jgi:hypothetical protein
MKLKSGPFLSDKLFSLLQNGLAYKKRAKIYPYNGTFPLNLFYSFRKSYSLWT